MYGTIHIVKLAFELARHPWLCSHRVNLRVARPLPERLPVIPEDDAAGTPQDTQRHVRHDRRDVPALDDPGCDKLRETIPPQVLVDGDGHEDGTGHWFVRVDRIGRADGW